MTYKASLSAPEYTPENVIMPFTARLGEAWRKIWANEEQENGRWCTQSGSLLTSPHTRRLTDRNRQTGRQAGGGVTKKDSSVA
jgi:hypothetical protein